MTVLMYPTQRPFLHPDKPPMPSNHTPQLLAQGGTPSSTPTPKTSSANIGPWSYNDVVDTITHEARACSTCSAWALHYMMSACNNDKTLRHAKDRHTTAVRAPLDAENATLREANKTLRRQLDWAHDDLARLRAMRGDRESTGMRRHFRDADEEPQPPSKRQRLSWAPSSSITDVTSVPDRNVGKESSG